MAKPLKILLTLIGAVLLLLVSAVVALPLLIDGNDFRAEIEQSVEQSTGRSLSLGELELKAFPWIRLRISDARLGNPEGFGEAPFAEVQTVDVGVQLLPLLFNRQLRVSTLTLEGLQVDLQRTAEGAANWETWATAPAEPAPTAEASATSHFQLTDIDVAGVLIRDASLRLDDAQAGQSLVVEDLDLSTGRIVPGQPFDLDTAVRLRLGEPAVALALIGSARVSPDEAFDRIAVQGLKLHVTAGGDTLVDGKPLNLKVALSGDLLARLAAQAYELKDLAVTVETGGSDTPNGLGLQSTLRLSASTVNANLSPDVANGGPAVALRGLSLQGSSMSKALIDGQDVAATLDMTGDADVQLSDQRVSLTNLKLDAETGGSDSPNGLGLKALLSLAGNPVASLSSSELNWKDLHLDYDLSHPEITAKGGVDGALSLQWQTLLARLDGLKVAGTLAGPSLPEPASLSLQSDLRYNGSAGTAALRDLVLTLDETTARGTVEVRDIATQALRFDLDVDQLDLDRYLPPAAPDAPKPSPGDKSGGINEIALPTDVLDGLNADGTLRIGSLKVNGLRLSEARITLSGPAGQPKRQQISAKLYGGTINLDHRYTPGATPGYALLTTLDSLEAAPFLQDLLGKDYVSGLAKLKLDLRSSGGTVGALRQGLNGQLSAEVRNGAVQGFNLAQVLRRGEALLSGQLAEARAEAASTASTDFASLSVSANIVNGLLKTDSLAAASPLFRLAGGGEIDLAKETINFLARPTVVETATGQDGKALENLRGLTIPIQLSGNLFAPKVRLDIQEALKNKALDGVRQQLEGEKAELEQKRKEEEARLKQKVEETITEKLGDGAVDQLRGLFGRPPRATPAPAPDAAPSPTPEAIPET